MLHGFGSYRPLIREKDDRLPNVRGSNMLLLLNIFEDDQHDHSLSASHEIARCGARSASPGNIEREGRFGQRGCMHDRNRTAAKKSRSRRAAVLVCIIAFAAAAGASAARLAPHDWPASLRSAWPRSSASLFSRGSPGPASFADVVDAVKPARSEEHTSELQSPCNLVCRLL